MIIHVFGTMEAETISNAYEPIDKLCVLAPGLLGASVAMACRENRVAKTISIWSRRSSSRAKLIDKDWCDEVCEDPETAVEDADFVVICSPVDFIMPLFNEIKDRLKPGAVVTDVGSTKSLICR
ncbi:MAG: prephenate dehydrogenase/arogenate dehydrogenase family protein, partial [Verrucomicrobiae bacterium]|nr:prephenate dehydrogenase/arogenate dehydrogenase family protein [Verrucomicrobiae bacterium]